MKVFVIIYLSIGALYTLAAGYLSHSTFYNFSKENQYDKINDIYSYDVIGKTLVVCVQGIKATDFFESRFQLSFPLDLLSNSGKRAQMNVRFQERDLVYEFDQYTIPRELVHKECSLNKKSEIETINVAAYQEYDQVKEFLSKNHNPAYGNLKVYKMHKYETDILNKKTYSRYVHLLVNNGESFVIDTKLSREYGSYIWLFLVPFACVVDAITYPYQIYTWVKYAG